MKTMLIVILSVIACYSSYATGEVHTDTYFLHKGEDLYLTWDIRVKSPEKRGFEIKGYWLDYKCTNYVYFGIIAKNKITLIVQNGEKGWFVYDRRTFHFNGKKMTYSPWLCNTNNIANGSINGLQIIKR